MSLEAMAGALLGLLDAPSIAFAVLDVDRRATRVSPLFAAALGVTVEDHLGRRLEHVIPAHAPPLLRAIERARAANEPVRDVELEIAGCVLSVSVHPIDGDDGAAGFVLVATDPVEPRHVSIVEPRFVEIVESAKSRFVDVRARDLDAEIDRSIARLGEALGAERVVAVELDAHGTLARCAAEWAREPPRERGARAAPVPASELTWTADELGPAGVIARGGSRLDEPLWVVARPRAGASTIGGVECTWPPGPRAWGAFLRARVQMLADTIGAAIHRRAADRLAQERLRFEALLSGISSWLLAPSGERLVGAIGEALGELARAQDADRAYVYLLDEQGIATLAHEWCAPGIPPREPRRLPLDAAPVLAARLRAGETWVIEDAATMSDALRTERDRVSRSGMRAQIVVPLVSGERLIGAIGLDDLRAPRVWSPALLERVKLVGQVFAHALARAESDAREREDRGLDEILAAISSSLIEVSSERSDAAIDAALDRLCEHVGLVRGLLIDVDHVARACRVTHAGGDRTALRRGVDYPIDELGLPPRELVVPGFHVARASQLPGGELRREWQRDGVVATASMSVRKDGDRDTLLVFVARAEETIARTFERRGAIVRELLANALARRDAELARERAFAELARLKRSAERERDYLREEVHLGHDVQAIVAVSAAMVQVLESVDAVAPTTATVLVRGETGVGKEMIARAIHARSPRAGAPLVKVDCASIPRELFETVFFGHVRGGPFGAEGERVGRFELANEGTIFLDEVGEIPLDLQPKLLRVLQEGELERIGDDRARRVDVRVIAATNRDLERDVEEGRFRRDLYYRLGVFPIVVPPLRERAEDVVPLARSFLARAARAMSRPELTLEATHERALRAYDWPGNVRELSHVIERAVILSPRPPLRLELALPARVHERTAAQGVPGEATRVRTEAEVRELERANLIAALERADHRIAGPGGAAALLQISPSTLRDRMRAFGIRSRPRR